jgi:Sulfotransferase family
MNGTIGNSGPRAPGRARAAESAVDGRPRAPEFLGIGAQKAGTSWLHANLRKHPGLWLPPIKELHYFDEIHIDSHQTWSRPLRQRKCRAVLSSYLNKVPDLEWDFKFIAEISEIAIANLNDDWYKKIFSLAASAQMCGEVNPDYLPLPDEGIAHVCLLAPDARFIVCLRDPIERNWSHVRMMAANQDIRDPTEIERLSLADGVILRSDYPRLLDRWSRFVDSGRMLTIFMDDIVARPAFVLSQVCGHLGVEYRENYFPKHDKIVHEGRSMSMPPTIYEAMKVRFQGIYVELAKRYPVVAGAWMDKHYGSSRAIPAGSQLRI